MPKPSEKHIPGACGSRAAGPVTGLLSVQSVCPSQGLSRMGQGNAPAAVVCEVTSVPPGRYTLTLASPWSGVLGVSKCSASGLGLHWGLSLVLHTR